jgi:hypothetical protein
MRLTRKALAKSAAEKSAGGGFVEAGGRRGEGVWRAEQG